MLRSILSRLPATFSVICAAGILVRLTIRDRVIGLSTLYYGTPTILLAAMAAVAAFGWRWKKRRVRAGIMGVASLACLIWWHAAAHFSHPAAVAGPEDTRVLFWNVAHGVMGWNAVAQAIAEYDADVVALSEGDPDDPSSPMQWDELLPQYNQTDVLNGMVVMVRGEILETTDMLLGDIGRCRISKLRLKDRSLTTILADLKSWPRASRAATLERLAEIAEQHAGGPTLILGDFNTPVDSVHFGALRRRYRHAFETAGNGYLVTWPLPLPILGLDHIWAGEGLDVTSCELGWSWRSDHRPVLVTIRPRSD